jgi:methionine synthase II (cobalamin-independent)
MKRSEYLQRAFEAYNEGRISGEVYDSMIENADVFCDEDEREYGLPSTYAEVEYDDFDNPEAIDGARFDDMNYLRYTER